MQKLANFFESIFWHDLLFSFIAHKHVGLLVVGNFGKYIHPHDISHSKVNFHFGFGYVAPSNQDVAHCQLSFGEHSSLSPP